MLTGQTQSHREDRTRHEEQLSTYTERLKNERRGVHQSKLMAMTMIVTFLLCALFLSASCGFSSVAWRACAGLQNKRLGQRINGTDTAARKTQIVELIPKSQLCVHARYLPRTQTRNSSERGSGMYAVEGTDTCRWARDRFQT